jgi:hypothetical protein
MKFFLKYVVPIQLGGQNKWLCLYSPIGWSVVAGTFLGHTFIEKSLTGALVGFFLGGILAEVFFYFKKKKLN